MVHYKLFSLHLTLDYNVQANSQTFGARIATSERSQSYMLFKTIGK